jgi:hypothetical protein
MNDLVIDITIPGLQNLCSSTLDGIEQGYLWHFALFWQQSLTWHHPKGIELS